MKTLNFLLLTFFTSLQTMVAQKSGRNNSNLPKSVGPFQGQHPPGLTAETFALDIITTKALKMEVFLHTI